MTSRDPGSGPIEMDGIRVVVPGGWEGRIRRFFPREGEESKPVTHLATIPLPPTRGDFGSEVVERMGPNDIFVSLLEYGPDVAGTSLFPDVTEFPTRVAPADLRANQLQRLIPGQAGKQFFFTYKGRPFCLYVVVGSVALRNELAGQITELLSRIEVETEAGSGGGADLRSAPRRPVPR